MALRSSSRSMARLLGDTGGNIFAMMAMAMIPLAGMVGGGVDMSRLYLAKTRLQQACDAGALAGRKTMGAGTWTFNGEAARIAAERYFDGNFAPGAYGTGVRTRVYTEAGGRVTGTSSVVVPMTIMRIFGNRETTLNATCDADMRLPNTDVMFVLDTTGSMEQVIPGQTETKIAGLRTAVKCFYETVARLDSNAACTGTAPSGGTGNQVQVRFGFVPYASNVNVGALLPAAHMADQWTYQTRVANFTTPVAGEVDSDIYEAYVVGANVRSISEGDCEKFGRNEEFTDENDGNRVFTPNPAGSSNDAGTGVNRRRTTYSNDSDTGVDRGYNEAPDRNGTFQSCRRRKIVQKIGTRRFAFTNWTYRADAIDVSTYKQRGAVSFANDACLLVVGDKCTNESIIPGTVANSGTFDERELATLANTQNIPRIDRTWDGCIEERATVRQAAYSPIPNGARDLNIDLIPSTTAGTRWGPSLLQVVRDGGGSRVQGVVYPRGADGADDGSRAASQISEYDTDELTTLENIGWPSYQCPAAARRLQAWADADAFDTYVDGLTTGGNTYHDIGMVWGARLISATGLFRADNEFTPQGAEIERHMIFMTDGETCTSAENYTTYGVEWFDRRRTDEDDVPSAGCETETTNGGTITQQVNVRTTALCNEVRNKNITLWVIWFGESKPNLEARLTACATPGRYFAARNGAQLQDTFRSIANQISQLRLTN